MVTPPPKLLDRKSGDNHNHFRSDNIYLSGPARRSCHTNPCTRILIYNPNIYAQIPCHSEMLRP